MVIKLTWLLGQVGDRYQLDKFEASSLTWTKNKNKIPNRDSALTVTDYVAYVEIADWSFF